MSRAWTFVLLLACICQNCLCATVDYDVEAKQFLSEASKCSFDLFNKIANETYRDEAAVDFDTIFTKLTTVMAIADELIKLSKDASEFDLAKIHSEEIKKALQEIRLTPEIFVLGKEYFESVLITIAALEVVSSDKDITPYLDGANMPNQSDEPLGYDPDIIKIIKKSNDPEELKYYWQTWREKNSIWASVNFYTIVEALQKAAKLLDISELDFWYRSYSNKHFYSTMEKVMQEFKPHYQQLHAFIRHELHKKYGAEVVNANGPIPDHLIQQVSEQVWGPGGVFEAYFPFSELPSYDSFVEKFSAKQMLSESNRFYSSMGFKGIDDEFLDKYAKEIEENESGADCRADIFDVTPQVYIRYCPNVDFRKFMQMHGYLNQAYYAKQKSDLPFYYFNSYNLEHPLGEAFILSASTPKHLSNIGLAKDFKFEEKTLKNRLFRMGVHTFFSIPQYFVLNKVMEDLLIGAVEMDGLNKHYWKLMEQHAGIEPPIDREENSIDFPYKFYNDIEYNYQTTKFVSEILGYQFYQAFCKKSGQEQELQNCDFYGNEAIGNEIRAMMSLGSSKPFAEVLGKVLGENATVSAEALLAYYAPMLDWIKSKNKETNVKIGWNATNKKVL